jgi:hypothetical protein
VWDVARMEENRNSYAVPVRKAEGKIPLGRQGHRSLSLFLLLPLGA